MRRRQLLSGLAAIALGVSIFVAPGSAHALSVDDVINMSKAKIGADIIITTIKASKSSFKLTATQIIALKKAGVADAVVKAMLATQGGEVAPESAFKAKVDPGSVAPAVPQRSLNSQQAARLAADEFRRAEAERKAEDIRRAEEIRKAGSERLQEAAARLKAEAERISKEAAVAEAEALRQKHAIDAALAEGTSLLRRGKNVEAVGAFHRFLTSGAVPKGSNPYSVGEYSLGEALTRLHMVSSAADRFANVLRRGPRAAKFVEAFRRMQEAAAVLDYDHPIYPLLASFSVSEFPQAFQDEYHFFLGQFFTKWGNGKSAVHHFSKVSKNSAHFGAARYQLGIVAVAEKRLKTAVRLFEDAVVAAETHKKPGLVRDLAHLALARIAYEVGNYDGAAFYYRKVDAPSTKVARAQYELGWAYFQRGDYSRALGTFHGLHGPFFARDYFPDLYVLEATVYLNLCHFAAAKEAVSVYRKFYEPLGVHIKRFLGGASTPDLLVTGVTESAKEEFDARKARLPRHVVDFLFADVDFYNYWTTLNALDKEAWQLSQAAPDLRRSFGATPELIRELSARVAERRKELVVKLAVLIQKLLRDADADLTDLKIKATEVVFEIEFAEKERLLSETQQLRQGGTVVERQGGRGRRAIAINFRGGEVYWPYDGDYWVDEVGSYRSFLKEACDAK
jgi:tetratricopeptide (TPR) repeat protein